jgi:hypothetical protein
MKQSSLIRIAGASATALVLTVGGITLANAANDTSTPTSATSERGSQEGPGGFGKRFEGKEGFNSEKMEELKVKGEAFKTSLQKLKDATTDEEKLAAANELLTQLKTQFGDKPVGLPGFNGHPGGEKGPRGEGRPGLDSSKLTTEQKEQVEQAQETVKKAMESFRDVFKNSGQEGSRGKPDVDSLTNEQKAQLAQAQEDMKTAKENLKKVLEEAGVSVPNFQPKN